MKAFSLPYPTEPVPILPLQSKECCPIFGVWMLFVSFYKQRSDPLNNSIASIVNDDPN